MELRTAEERKVWRDVAGCVNLSPSENEIISAHARASWLVKSYTPRRLLRRRPWPEVVAANNLPARLLASSEFDVMLWGSWHDVNIAGISWFLESVIPLQPRLAAARVLVAGRVIQGMSDALAEHPNVIAVGFVEDIDDFAARAKVLVIPDLAGTGMSRKVLDALTLGACFASTAAGMRDIDLGRSGYRPSVDEKELAEDIEHLLASPAARSERSRMASELYELNVSEVAYYRAWDSILETVVPGLPLRPGLRPEAGNPSLVAAKADQSIGSAQQDSRRGLR
jgi:glycosyltransferase involved in cell wall biosynthesis